MRLGRAELLWLIVVATLFALWWLPGTGSIDSDSYSVAFAGKKVLYQSLQRLTDDVRRSTEQLVPRPEFGDRILILGPARQPTSKEWSQLFNEVVIGGTLIFAASSNDAEVELVPFGARITSYFPKPAVDMFPSSDKSKDATVEEVAPRIESESDAKKPAESSPESSGEIDGAKRRRFETWNESVTETRLVDSQVNWRTRGFVEVLTPDWEVLVTSDSKPQVARKFVGAGTIVVSASDDIFGNGALTEPNQALLAFRILDSAPGDGRTWFDETLNGSGVPKVVGMLFDPLFRPLTLQCFLILALFGWSGCHRFGPIQPSLQPQQRSIVEHVRAIGILYFRAGAHAVRVLHEFMNLELRRIYGSGFRVDDPQSISRVTQTSQEEVSGLLKQIGTELHTPLAHATAGRLLRSLLQLLSQIRTNQKGGRGAWPKQT